jgi:hypothetical protein
MSSTEKKFEIDNKLSNKEEKSLNIFMDPCIEVQYTYYVNSLTDETFYFLNNISRDLVKKVTNLLPNAEDCEFDNLPFSLPITLSGYDLTYNLLFKRKQEDFVDLIVKAEGEKTIVKVLLYSSSGNNLNVFLYKNQSASEPPSPADASIARSLTSFDEKVLFAMLPP